MSSRGPAEPRPLTSWRALLGVLALIAVMVGSTVWAISQEIRARVLDATVEGNTFVSSLVVERAVTYADIRGGMHPQNRAQLDADFYLLRARQEVTDLRIWSLTDGSAVFRGGEVDDGGRLPDETLARARAGGAFVAGPTAGTAASTITIFYPFDANGDGTGDAVSEVSLPRRRLETAGAGTTRVLYGAGVLVLLLAVLGVAQVRRRQVVQDRAATHDLLTGLGNRVLLRRRAAPLLADASTGAPVALLVIDLDGFKSVNDTLGHQAGDDLLIAVARELRAAARPGDTVARLGGDEFAVLLPRTDAERAVRIGEQIRRTLRVPVQLAGLTVEIDASVGVACAPEHHTALSGLMHCADVAMYQAKRGGAGVVAYAASADDTPAGRYVTVLPQLRQALQDGALEVHYQPVVQAGRGPATEGGTAARVRDVEALLRWRHPSSGLLPAAEFLPAVERTSLIRPLTEWVLACAAAQVAGWRAAGHDVRVTVNVAARILADPRLPDVVAAAADGAGVPPARLRLEISEAGAAEDPAAVATAVRRLAEFGVGVALDDVRAGFPVLTALAGDLPEEIKIDAGLIGAVRTDPAARHAVAGLVTYAGQLGLNAVAEGVEEADTWSAVAALGCAGVQGYAVCPPLPGGELAGWLTDRAGTRAAMIQPRPEPAGAALTEGSP